MKKSLIAVLASPLVLVLACAHEEHRDGRYEQRHQQAYAPQPGERVVAGRLVNVTDQSITIAERDGDQRTLWIDPRTSVTVDGRAGDLRDLRPGQDVRAAFDEGSNGQRVAVSIESVGGGGRWRGDAYGRDRDRR